MRRWLLLVLILLLPLRGWIGEAMAGEMLARHIAVAAAAADGHAGHHAHEAHAHEHAPAAHAPDHDCAGHAQPDVMADAGTPLPDAGCNTCASCQVCSSVALGFDVPAMPVIEFGHTPPSARLPHFASAELRLGRKPPIS